MDTTNVVKWLGGADILPSAPTTELEMLELVSAGIPTIAIDQIIACGKLDRREVYNIIIPQRTLSHRRDKKQHLTAEESDRLTRVARIMTLAEDTFGSAEKARAWMRRQRASLGGKQPISLLGTEQGARLVEQLLFQMSHGVYI